MNPAQYTGPNKASKKPRPAKRTGPVLCRTRESVRFASVRSSVRSRLGPPKQKDIRKDVLLFWVPPPGGRRCPAVFQCSGKMNSPCSKVFVKGEACTAQARRQPESWGGSRRAGFDLGLGGILIYSAAMFQNGNRCGFDRWKGTPFSRGPFLLFTVAKDLKAILSQGTTSYF